MTDELLSKYGIAGRFTWEMKAEQMGKPAFQAAQSMFEHFPELLEKVNPQEWIEQRNALQAHAFTRTKPMPGALALVRYLRDNGVPFAIATGSNLANLKWKTSHLPELFSLFRPECIVTADSEDVKRGKPFPDIYLAAARSMGRNVGTLETCSEEQRIERALGVVFEDAIPGVIAGVSAGMNVIWVPDAALLSLHPNNTFGAKQILPHLEAFRPEDFGL